MLFLSDEDVATVPGPPTPNRNRVKAKDSPEVFEAVVNDNNLKPEDLSGGELEKIVIVEKDGDGDDNDDDGDGKEEVKRKPQVKRKKKEKASIKMEFTVLNSPRGFRSSLRKRPHFILLYSLFIYFIEHNCI